MKTTLIIILLHTLQSCIIHYDRLEYYVEGYNPNNNSFSTNGFYYTKSDTTVHRSWPNAIEYIYFFKDGIFNWGSNVEYIDSLDNWICKFGEKEFRYGPFGFYTIINDTIYVEYIVTDLPGFTKAERYEFKATKTDEGINIFEMNDEKCSENWMFHENTCVPDSIKNWMKRHRKYKI